MIELNWLFDGLLIQWLDFKAVGNKTVSVWNTSSRTKSWTLNGFPKFILNIIHWLIHGVHVPLLNSALLVGVNKDIHSFRIAEHFTNVSDELWIKKLSYITRSMNVGEIDVFDFTSLSRKLDACGKWISSLLEIVVQFSKSVYLICKALLRSSFSQIVSELEHGFTNMFKS